MYCSRSPQRVGVEGSAAKKFNRFAAIATRKEPVDMSTRLLYPKARPALPVMRIGVSGSVTMTRSSSSGNTVRKPGALAEFEVACDDGRLSLTRLLEVSKGVCVVLGDG